MIGHCLLWPEISLVWPKMDFVWLEMRLVWLEMSLVWPEITVGLISQYIDAYARIHTCTDSIYGLLALLDNIIKLV
jgi:hypothetical protein